MSLPKIIRKPGDKLQVLGKTATIRRVWPFGTVDVEMPSGKWLRVTGLPIYQVKS